MDIYLTNTDIQKKFSRNTYDKGLSYFKSGRALEASFHSKTHDFSRDKTEIAIKGVVKSATSKGVYYSQDIYITKYSIGEIGFGGYCSCYIRFNCKHMVSALLLYVKENTGEIDSKARTLRLLDNWIDMIPVSNENEDKKQVAQNNYKLQYRLINKNLNEYGFSVYGTKSKPLKRGGFSKPANVNFEYLVRKNHDALPSFIAIEDEEILALFSRMNTSYYGQYTSQFNLRGVLGGLILQKMLETGRCFLDNSEIPLKMGGVKSSKIDWKKIDSDYKLSVLIDEDSQFIHTEPPFYVCSKTLTIGEVKNFNLYKDSYHQLIELSPKIPEDVIDSVSETIIRKLPSLPPLVSKKIKHTKVYSKPKAHLILNKHQIELSYNYQGNIIKDSSKSQTISKKDNDDVLTIFRDIEEEIALKNRMLQFGFVNSAEREDVFQNSFDLSISSAIENWRIFKDETIPKLKNEGWTVDILSSFNYEFQDVEDVEINISEKNNWFEIEMTVEIDNKKLSLLPMVTQFLTQVEDIHNLDEKINIPFANGKFIRISSDIMKPIINTIIELYDGNDDEVISIGAFEAHTVDFLAIDDEHTILKGSEKLIELSQKLKNFKGLKNIKPPKGLTTELRDYQRIGLNWLDFLREFKFGGILADDMGLGKTIQTLTFLQREKELKRLKKPVLIVMPTSLLGNWRRESEKFTPDLNVLILHGDKRKTYFKHLGNYDLVLTTYGLISRDFKELLEIDFYYLILDEAQKIKNPKAKISQHLRQLKSDNRLALTGTPMENHLGELWSIYTFLMPGFLGQMDKFNKNFRKPIEKENNKEVREILKKRIEPFMLRRKKDEVVKELPKKTVIVQTVTFDKKQAQLYETIRITMEKRVRSMIAEKGLASSQITILDALLKLRQVCCDPSILKLNSSKDVKESAKLDALLNLVEELIAEGRKILLFSQFTTMLTIIEDRIIEMGVSYTKLTGSTRDRDSVIEKFKSGNADLFLISLKAGGVGLNLTEADTVIHYDPWWNPAVEEQATDRAYRIGQDKPVFVYKLIAEKTVEEKILELQDKKRALANIMIDNSKEKFELTQDDINNLFSPIH